MRVKKKTGAAKKGIPMVKKVSLKLKKNSPGPKLKPSIIRVTKETSDNKAGEGLVTTVKNTSVTSLAKKKNRKPSNVSKQTNGNTVIPGNVSGEAPLGNKKRNRKRKAGDVSQMDTDSSAGKKMGLSAPSMKRDKRMPSNESKEKSGNVVSPSNVTGEATMGKKKRNRKKKVVSVLQDKRGISTPTMKRDLRKMGKGKGKVQEKGGKVQVKVQESAPNSGRKLNALNYLKMWNEDRENWKFKKATQIWLNDHCMNETDMSDACFKTWLNYMENASPGQKQVVLGKATAVIAALEKEGSTDDPGDVKCQRARIILQSLNVEEDSSS